MKEQVKELLKEQQSDYDNYQARVVEIKEIFPHPNADRLAITNFYGSNVIIGLNQKVGDIGLYFIGGTQLSEEFANANDLIRRKNLETGATEGGMFDANRRVRTQNLRGEASDGFFIGLESLLTIRKEGTVGAWPEVGDSFSVWGGVPVCNKYIPRKRAPGVQGSGRQGKGRRDNDSKMFLRHFDTPQLRFVAHILAQFENLYKPLVITEKIHGTSQRVGNVMIQKELRGFKKFLFSKIFGLPSETHEYKHLIGTRRTIVRENTDGYYSSSFRKNASEPFLGKLRKGETVYYEVAGYEGVKPIMGSAENKKVSKEFVKHWGKTTEFTYGNKPGDFSIYIYRITLTNEDGEAVDLPWTSVKQRCLELDVPHVPEHTITTVMYILSNMGVDHNDTEEVKAAAILKWMDGWTDIPTVTDGYHICEGACLRVDDLAKPLIYKHKGTEFKILEGIIKPSDIIDEAINEEL